MISVEVLQDKRLTFRERVIIVWVMTMGDRSAVQICDALGLGINATQITLKNLAVRGYLHREKFNSTYYYRCAR